MHKENNIRILISAVVIGLLFFWNCGSKPPTEAEKQIIELEKQLVTKPDDVDLIGDLVKKYFMNHKFDKAISLYESHEQMFADNPLVICHYAAASASKAGQAEKIEAKLKWVKKSMITLDNCVQKFPDNYIVYLWRGMTYSNLPSILNARPNVEKDLELVMNNFHNGTWILSTEDLQMVYMAYLNLVKEYKDDKLYDIAYENLKKDLPDETLIIYQTYKEYRK